MNKLFTLLTAFLITCSGFAQQNNFVVKKKWSNQPQNVVITQKTFQQLTNPNLNIRKLAKMADAKSEKLRIPDDPMARIAFEKRRLVDPVTGEIPANIKKLEREYVLSSISGLQSRLKAGNLTYTNSGPRNVGGRTRALAIDISDASGNTILAGGVTGGLWKSTDNGATWRRVTGKDQHPSITAIAQDPRDGHTDTWYYVTGEYLGPSATAPGAFYVGNGVYKSTDNGETWQSLEATASNSPLFNNRFDICWNVCVDPTNGDVYVATYGGIKLSTDGGQTWTDDLDTKSGDNYSSITDVICTAEGVKYATCSSNGGKNKGIFRKAPNQNTWEKINPGFLPYSYERLVLGQATSVTDKDVIYVLGYTPYSGSSNNSLWKLEYNNSANWTNLSSNLPSPSGYVGGFNSQGGYDLIVKVAPDNEDMVFIGGTNLFRSDNGFTSTSKTYWIGGYSTANDVSLYPNHHPDIHSLAFKADNKSLICGSDGGLSLTTDYTTTDLYTDNVSTPVKWEYLNNAYMTTQSYAVAIEQNNTSDKKLVSGFQDNGTWYGENPDAANDWGSVLGGDGCYCALINGGTEVLASAQGGVIYLQSFQNDTWSRIDPDGASGMLFVNPFITDSNNDNIMYFAGGKYIWRNTNISEIPKYSNKKATKNWKKLSITQSNAKISALASSVYPVHILYYGTSNGKVYKMTNSHNDDAKVTEITGSNMPGSDKAYVSYIAINPTNADDVLVTFSNYKIQSVFHTTDGGANWTAVGGNLEPSNNNGPSVRTAGYMVSPTETTYFLGTSTGIYSTTNLDGNNTKWTQQALNKVGTTVVDMIKIRRDGFFAIGSHGNGVFSADADFSASKPLANIGYSRKIIEPGESVDFINHSIGDGITSYSWTFEGAETETSDEENPKGIVYNQGGRYTVTLTVTNAQGSDTKTLEQEIIVGNQLVANFKADKTEVVAGEEVSFTDSSTGDPTSWNWTFDGGTPSSSTEQNPKVVYNTPGTYDVTLTIENGDKSDTKTKEAYIVVKEEVTVDFTADKTTVKAGEEVSFTDNSTGDITDWEWTFNGGDPASSTMQNPKVVYNTPGTYDVTLKVTDKNGTVKTETKEAYITVEEAEPPLVADFTADVTQVTVGATVKFTDNSEGNPTAWNWTFDGGTPDNSTVQNPEVVYNTPGTYDVTLTISKDGKSDTKTKKEYIVVMEEVNVDFTADKTTVKAGEEVAFTDNSTGAITNWEWTFNGGDPASSTMQNPKVVYNTPGTYDVTLKVTDKYGTVKTETKEAYITVEEAEPPLVADFTADVTQVTVGATVKFTDNSEGNPTAWNWTFDGGTPDNSNAQNPEVVYNTPGTYDVTLTISKDGKSDTKTKKEYIVVMEEVNVDFTADKTNIKTGEEVAFTDNSTGEITDWEWTFNGGNPATSTVQNPKVVYNTAGTYDVTLKVTDKYGTVKTKTKEAYITVEEVEPPLAADFVASATKVKVGETVKFTDNSEGNPTAWNWTFDGGTPGDSDVQNPEVVYNTPGTYDVTLTVSKDGESDTKTKQAYITVVEEEVPLVADFTADVTQITVGGEVNFTDKSEGNPTDWEWEFEGGTPNNSTSQNPKVVYNTPGTYDVTLTISKDGKSDTETKKGYIVVMEKVEVDFIADKTNIKTGEEVTFTDKSTGAITNWEWTFNGGDPATSTMQNPKVVYNTPGTYDVTLKVTDKYGTVKTETKEAYITVEQAEPPLVADFTADVTQVTVGGTVKFTDNSEGNPTAWNWTFDGGTPGNSDVQNPEVVYNTPGTYDVTLTISKDGKSDTKVKKAYIVVMEELTVDFTADKTTIKAGEEVAFTDNSTGAITNWEWTFNGGDPATSTMQNPKVVYNTAGTYDVTLKVTDKYGTVKTETKEAYITVEEAEPELVADFTADVTQVTVGGTVKFTDNSEGNPTAWNWTFDGGTPDNSDVQNPEVVYNTPGTYDVTLTVSKDGKSDTKVKKAYIVVMEELTVDFTADKTTIKAGEEVAFTDNSTGAITEWEWTFNGGDPATSTMQNPKVVYNTAGTYDVTLKVTDKYGTVKTETKKAYITVEEAEPELVADFTADKTTVYVGESVQFTNTSQGNPTSWSWNFTGGTPNTSTEENPTVTYNEAGTFDVTLTVGRDGESNTLTKKAFITVKDSGTGDDEWLYNVPEELQNSLVAYGDEDDGYFTGQNSDGTNAYAERFELPSEEYNCVTKVQIAPAAINAQSDDAYITLKIWTGKRKPTKEVYTEKIALKDLQVDQFNTITLKYPVAVNDVFYVGYEVNYTKPIDQFAVYHTPFDMYNTFPNTAYMKYAGRRWVSFPTTSYFNFSLAIKAMVGYSASAEGAAPSPYAKLQESKVKELTIYPNPMSEQTRIEFPNKDRKQYRLVVIDASGKVVRIINNITNDNFIINRGQLRPGVHILNLSGEKLYKGKLLVK